MPNLLMMYLAEAVVERAKRYRPGARHAMLIFVAAGEEENFDARAVKAAEDLGWMLVDLKKSKRLEPDTDLIEDDVLRQAAEDAVSRGTSLVVYKDEIASHA